MHPLFTIYEMAGIKMMTVHIVMGNIYHMNAHKMVVILHGNYTMEKSSLKL